MRCIVCALMILVMGMLLLGTGEAQGQGLEPGAQMPSGALEGPQGTRQLAQLAGERGTLVVFWSNQCPWTDRYENRLLDLRSQYGGQGIAFVFVNPNAGETLEGNEERGYPMPYLKDSGATVARAFGAERTPHVFLFGAQGALAYAGGIDDSPGDPGNVEETPLADALSALVEGEEVPVAQTEAFGCTIKF